MSYIARVGDPVKVVDSRDREVVMRGKVSAVNVDIDDRANDWVEVEGIRVPRLCVWPADAVESPWA